MAPDRPDPRTPGRARAAALAALVLLATGLVALAVDRSSAISDTDRRLTGMPGMTGMTRPNGGVDGSEPSPGVAGEPGRPERLPPLETAGLGEADGVVHEGMSPFDDATPAVARLDPALHAALRAAAGAARREGVTLTVDSGWRSPAYQEQLLREAVAKYGSAAEAARWVATPATSAHVSGDAVDVGPVTAASWLARHGQEFGLCRVYANEPWHFERRADAARHGCPALYPDPSHDPRMHR